jgi:UDP-N-acetylmuramoylalanine--D-glutamate ligase
MLNITEDHLNRFEYKMENYIAAKCRIFENQRECDFAVLNYDDPIVRDMRRLTKARIVYFSMEHELKEGMYLEDGRMVWCFDGNKIPLIHVSELKIPGAHNVQNALCAASLGLCMGLNPAKICEGLKSFKGVEHRIEFVREVGGVQYINDSKGTNPDSTIKAVQAMTRPTVLLLGVGNYDKKSDFLPLFQAFDGKIKAVIASGINVPAIMDAAKRAGYTNVHTFEGDLDALLREAKELTCEGDTVLLSPAAASWGIFSDYEERGREFKKAVMRI